jgi:hypothetical protein
MADYDVAVHNSRVFTDSGQVPDNITTDRYVRLLKQANLWDSCVFFGDTARGVKKDANQFVSKMYDIKGNADLSQGTGTKQPKYDSSGGLLCDGNDWIESDLLGVANQIRLVSTNCTVSVWVKRASSTATQYIFSRYGVAGELVFGINFQATTSRVRVFMYNTSDVISKNYEMTSIPTIGEWCHLVFTFAPNDLKLYFNGVLETPYVKTVDLSLASMNNSEEGISLCGGTMGGETGNCASGTVVALPIMFNSTLTAEQILWNFNNIRPEGV